MKNVYTLFLFITSLIVTVLFRLLKGFALPNFNPIMGVAMPFAKHRGPVYGFAFTTLSMLIFDKMSGMTHSLSIFNALTYGFIGLAAGTFFKNRNFGWKNRLGFTVVGTIVYDALTGIVAPVLMSFDTLEKAFAGQILFTGYHLLGNAIFALVVSPLLYTYLMQNPWFVWGRRESARA